MVEREQTVHWEEAIRAAVRVRDADPAFAARLRLDLARKAAGAAPARPVRTWRPVWAAAAILLALATGVLLLLGPEKVAAALRSLFGYVPGAGFVRLDAPFRILSEPVRAEKDGASLYILQVLAEGGRTVVVYETDCPGPESQWLKSAAYCAGAPVLVLPDGAVWKAEMRSGRSDLPYYRERAVFAAVPSGVSTVIFRIPFRASPGSGAEPWSVELELKPFAGEATVYPVLEAAPASAAAPSVPESDPLPDGMRIRVERIVALPDGYFLQGSLEWDPGRYAAAEADSARMEIVAGDGDPCPLEFAAPDPDPDAGENRSAWAVRFNPRGRSGPFRLRVRSITARLPAAASFAVDFGAAPAVGSVFPLDVPVRAAGYGLRVTAARIEARGDSFAVVFTFRGPEDAIGAGWIDGDQPALPDPESALLGPGVFESGAAYRSLPAGRHTIRVDSLQIRRRGMWILPVEVNF